MTSKTILVFCVLALAAICLPHEARGTAGVCVYEQSFDDAVEQSRAIFIGKAIEEEQIPLSSKGGTDLSYRNVKFDVERSWKLIDRRYVWVRIPGSRPDGCGYIEIGSSYLIYANQTNEVVFISPQSRTMPAAVASDDLARLGNAHLYISGGTFRTYGPLVWIILALLAIPLLIFAFYKIYKQKLSDF